MKNLCIKKVIWFLVAVAAVGCSEKSSQLVPMPTQVTEAVSEKPVDVVSFTPKVDILFVIDNSGSMDSAQQNLSKNIKDFASAITSMSILDYHIGVVSTDCSSSQLCGALKGRNPYIDKNTQNAAFELQNNMLLGISGSGTEIMFDPVVQALSNSNLGITTFYRPDAFLAVIIITDAADQGSYSAQAFYNRLVSVKGDRTKVLAYGVIRKLAEENICNPGVEYLDSKLEDFLSLVVNADKNQNNVLSLCAPNYGIKLAEFAKDIVKRSSGYVRLQRIPNVKTIRISYGTQIIPNRAGDGWIYEVSTNSIIFGSDIKWQQQGPNTKLSIDFEAIEI